MFGCAAQTDDSVSPQNFNGTFTFGGGTLAPVLDAQNRPVPAPTASRNWRRSPRSSVIAARLLFQQLGDTPSMIRELGGGATQFTINTGTAELRVKQFDVGFFAGDEWRVRPNLTLNLGLRYETQTNIHDWRDLRLAWRLPGRPAAVDRSAPRPFCAEVSVSSTIASLSPIR